MSPSRRQLLHWSGAALAAPFLASGEARARPTPEGAPKRLIVFHHSQGQVLSRFLPVTTDPGFALPYALAPLEPFRDRMLVFGGLDNVMPRYNRVGNAHDNGNLTLFPGAPFLVQDDAALTAAGPSFEQVLAERIGGDTPFARLDLAAGGPRANGIARQDRFFYGPYDPVTVFNDPFVAALRIFGDQTQSPAEVAAVRARRTTVLDAVMQNFASMRGRLPAADRERLDAHEDKVAALQARITRGLGTCTAPEVALPPGYDFTYDDAASGPVLNDILVAALACDYTRVATVSYLNGHDHAFPWLTELHGGPIVGPGWDNWHAMVHADFQPGMELVFRWYVQMFADLLTKLDAELDADGENLLDTSLVLYMPEFSSGRHWTRGIPAVVAGGMGGAPMGRYLDYLGGSLADFVEAGGYLDSTATTNQLFTSIFRAFGFSDESFGHRPDERPSGILPGLFG